MNGVEIALAGYLAFGQLIPHGQQEIVKHAGLQVLHADGAVTLRLKEAGREKRAEGGAEVTTIRLVDELYPFEVTRHVKSWNDCDAVETWVEIRHSEGGPVRLICTVPHDAKLDGRRLSLALHGPYDSAVFEISQAD